MPKTLLCHNLNGASEQLFEVCNQATREPLTGLAADCHEEVHVTFWPHLAPGYGSEYPYIGHPMAAGDIHDLCAVFFQQFNAHDVHLQT